MTTLRCNILKNRRTPSLVCVNVYNARTYHASPSRPCLRSIQCVYRRSDSAETNRTDAPESSHETISSIAFDARFLSHISFIPHIRRTHAHILKRSSIPADRVATFQFKEMSSAEIFPFHTNALIRRTRTSEFNQNGSFRCCCARVVQPNEESTQF